MTTNNESAHQTFGASVESVQEIEQTRATVEPPPSEADPSACPLSNNQKKRIARRKAKLAKWQAKFPKLPFERLEQAYLNREELYTKSDVESHFQLLATKTHWQKLGYSVELCREGKYLVRGSQIFPVYYKCGLRERSTNQTPQAIWNRYCQRFGSSAIALAEAIRHANRLQKVFKYPSFYKLKDEWIVLNEEHALDGRISREESRICYDCDGMGKDWSGNPCRKCSGSGLYSTRNLYEHHFQIEERHYCFHSYIAPTRICELPGADKRNYGRPFRSHELPLPPQSKLIEAVRLGLAELWPDA